MSGHYEFGKTTCSGGGPSPGSSPGSGGPGRPVGGILNNIDRYKFPCAFKVSQRLITEKKSVVANFLQTVFNESRNVELVISTGKLDANVNAQTDYIPRSLNDVSNTVRLSIIVNESITSCTTDRLYSTIMHEVIHAYISEMQRTLSASEFNSRFPLYNYGGLQTRSVAEIADHNYMADTFISKFIFGIRANNINLSSEHARHLAWSGLQQTNAWKQLSSSYQQQVNATNSASRCPNGKTPSISTYKFELCNK